MGCGVWAVNVPAPAAVQAPNVHSCWMSAGAIDPAPVILISTISPRRVAAGAIRSAVLRPVVVANEATADPKKTPILAMSSSFLFDGEPGGHGEGGRGALARLDGLQGFDRTHRLTDAVVVPLEVLAGVGEDRHPVRSRDLGVAEPHAGHDLASHVVLPTDRAVGKLDDQRHALPFRDPRRSAPGRVTNATASRWRRASAAPRIGTFW